MNEVVMAADLHISEEIELGPEDVPPSDDESGDGEDDEFAAERMEDGAASSTAAPPHEHIEDLSIAQLIAHSAPVYAVAVNAVRSTCFATGGGDDVVRLWDTADLGAPAHTLRGHSETISALAFSADGELLASAGLDGMVRVWAAATGGEVASLEGPTQGMNWLCWHHRGQVLLAGSEDATAWMWKLPEGSVMQIFSAHSASVSYGGFANNGRAVITASEDGTVRLWNPRAGTVDHCIHAGSAHDPVPITCLGVHPAQPVFLCGAADGTLKLGHAENGKVLALLSAHDSSVENVDFCDCMPLAVSGGMDGRLCVWDLTSFQLRHTCTHTAGIVEVRFRRESALLLSCSISRELRLWDSRDGSCIRVLTGHRDAVLCMAVAYTEKGVRVISGSDDNTARVWALDV